MIQVEMPQLGESVVEGTVTKWRVKEGDSVEKEQPIVEVATDKADTEIPSPVSGVVTKIAVSEGTLVAKGGLLCVIEEGATKKIESKATTSTKKGKKEESSKSPTPLSSPSVRKLALEAGVELSEIEATGDRGRITHEDVLRNAVPNTKTETRPEEVSITPHSSSNELSQLIHEGGGFHIPMPGIGYGSYKVPAYVKKDGDEIVAFSRRRRITADHMVYSKFTSPHVVTVAEVDLHATSKLREAHKEQFKKDKASLTFLSFVCAATVKALRENPQVNARVLDNSFALLKDINLGIAVDTPAGLVVPSIKQAQQLSLRGIASGIDEVATRARNGKITADDLSGTSFTVSNPGLKGNLFGGAIISQPNVGILRMGEIKKRVVVVSNKDGEDTMAIHPVMYVAFSYDHRIIDGVLANTFLWRVSDILSKGEFEI